MKCGDVISLEFRMKFRDFERFENSLGELHFPRFHKVSSNPQTFEFFFFFN